MFRELYRRGSVSQAIYRRAVANREIAKANLEAIKSATETQRKLREIEIAKARLAVVQQEYDIAQQLLQSGSISQTKMAKITSDLKIATAELESRKKALGARAIEVKR